MKQVPQEAVVVGEDVAAAMYDLSCLKAFSSDPNIPIETPEELKEYDDIIMAYINEEITSALGIYLAIDRAIEKIDNKTEPDKV
jgi:hypothetical protein